MPSFWYPQVFLGLSVTISSCLHVVFPLNVSASVHFPLPIRMPVILEEAYPNDLVLIICEDPVSQCPIHRYWGGTLTSVGTPFTLSRCCVRCLHTCSLPLSDVLFLTARLHPGTHASPSALDKHWAPKLSRTLAPLSPGQCPYSRFLPWGCLFWPLTCLQSPVFTPTAPQLSFAVFPSPASPVRCQVPLKAQ